MVSRRIQDIGRSVKMLNEAMDDRCAIGRMLKCQKCGSNVLPVMENCPNCGQLMTESAAPKKNLLQED